MVTRRPYMIDTEPDAFIETLPAMTTSTIHSSSLEALVQVYGLAPCAAGAKNVVGTACCGAHGGGGIHSVGD